MEFFSYLGTSICGTLAGIETVARHLKNLLGVDIVPLDIETVLAHVSQLTFAQVISLKSSIIESLPDLDRAATERLTQQAANVAVNKALANVPRPSNVVQSIWARAGKPHGVTGIGGLSNEGEHVGSTGRAIIGLTEAKCLVAKCKSHAIDPSCSGFCSGCCVLRCVNEARAGRLMPCQVHMHHPTALAAFLQAQSNFVIGSK